MLTRTCSCGARYKILKHAKEKTVHCKKCGQSIVFDEEKVQHDSSSWEGDSDTAPRSHVSPDSDSAHEFEISAIEERRSTGFWRAFGWNLFFPASPHNLKIFLSLWAIFSVISLIPSPRISVLRFILLPLLWATLFLAAFRVESMETTAGGGFELPELELTTDILYDILEPAYRWYLSWLLALLPAFIYVVDRAYSKVNVLATTQAGLESLIGIGLGPPTVDSLLIAMVLFGLCLWPVIACLVVLGEFKQIWKLPRLVPALLSTSGPYAAVVIVGVISTVVFVLSLLLAPSNLSIWVRSTGFAGPIAQRFLWMGAEVYLGIVLARSVGIYFYHYGYRISSNWTYTADE